MRRAAQLVGGAACLLLLAAEATALPDPVQAWSAEGSAVAFATGRGLWLELPDGRRQELSAPAGAEVASLAAVGAGWAAAGSYVAADGRHRLWIRLQRGEAARALAEPPGQVGEMRRAPVLLAAGGRLAGLAWLEGDGERTLAVRASTWDSGRWSRPERVSGVGPGSQLALSGAALADGSWLVVWSAFDGRDDEVIWSRRAAGRWQPIARVSRDNDVPDITPALVPAAGGALAAWSRFDGSDYRVVLSRFAGGRWVEERTVGEAGSLYPRFGQGRGGPRLLYLLAQPRAWALLALDAAGEVRARGAVATDRGERPALAPGGGGRPRLRWLPDGGAADLEFREVPR